MDQLINTEGIVSQLKDIFNKRFELNMGNIPEDDFTKELLGSTWGMKPRDLIYLFFDIEKKFEIKIPQEDIAEGRFNTFNNIVEIINAQLNKAQKELAR